MKKIERLGAQGDVMFRRVDTVPAGLVEQPAKGARVVVAHSETGHDHYLAATGVALFADPADPMVCYLRIEGGADVVHARPFDTHETLRLGAGVWQVRRQREHTPKGWRRVED